MSRRASLLISSNRVSVFSWAAAGTGTVCIAPMTKQVNNAVIWFIFLILSEPVGHSTALTDIPQVPRRLT
jgi:hypothetical protein